MNRNGLLLPHGRGHGPDNAYRGFRRGRIPPAPPAYLGFALLVATLAAGCIQPRPTNAPEPQVPASAPVILDARYAETARQIQADPVGFMRDVGARSEALDQYRLTFYRQERFGGRLRDMEKIDAFFRKSPFSVKFVWPDPGADYYESVYVAGENDNRLVVRERKGALPLLPPTTRRIKPEDSVTFGRSKNPITDFGLARVTQRTLIALNDPELARDTAVRYLGMIHLDPQNRPAFVLRVERPPHPQLQYTRNEFYIDAETLLPAGVDLYLPDGELDARYRYADLKTEVNLTAGDFRITTGKKR